MHEALDDVRVVLDEAVFTVGFGDQCHACGLDAELCDVDRLRGLGWCSTCLADSQVCADDVDLGSGG